MTGELERGTLRAMAKRSAGAKLRIYLAGVVLGIIVLMLMPREEREEKAPHPWHAQTAPESAYPLSLTDATGTLTTLPQQPRWVASLAPSVTETLAAMGMADHLMAVTRWCEVPAELGDIPFLGSLDTPDREKLAVLKPHLILGSSLTPTPVYARLRGDGHLAYAMEFATMEGVLKDIATMGKLLGVPGKALALDRRLRAELDEIGDALKGVREESPRRVVLLYGLDGLFSAASGTWAGDILAHAHTRNLADGAGSPWPQLSFESLLVNDPEVILVTASEDPEDQRQTQLAIDRLASQPGWEGMTAVKEGRVILIPGDVLSIPGPRMTLALDKVARAVWPEAFGE